MPTPKSPQIKVSDLQEKILTKISLQRTSSIREVERSRLLLEINKGLANTQIEAQSGFTKEQAQRWRRRWLSFESVLLTIEMNKDKEDVEYVLEKKIREILKDAPRPGAVPTFSAEQYCQIVAIALEDPKDSGRAISQWSGEEIRQEAIKRGIVKSISKSQVGIFLKGKRNKTP
jgi:putative transposase